MKHRSLVAGLGLLVLGGVILAAQFGGASSSERATVKTVEPSLLSKDTAFGTQGTVNFTSGGLFVAYNGGVVVGVSGNEKLVRRTVKGAADSAFGTRKFSGSTSSMATSHGKPIVVTSECVGPGDACIGVFSSSGAPAPGWQGPSGFGAIYPMFSVGCSNPLAKSTGVVTTVVLGLTCKDGKEHRYLKLVYGKVDKTFGGGKGLVAFPATTSVATERAPSSYHFPLATGELMVARTLVRSDKPGQYKLQLSKLNAAGVPYKAFGFAGGTERAVFVPESQKIVDVKVLSVTKDSAGRFSVVVSERTSKFHRTVLVRFTSTGAVDKTLNGTGAKEMSPLRGMVPGSDPIRCSHVYSDKFYVVDVDDTFFPGLGIVKSYSMKNGALLKERAINGSTGQCSFSALASRLYAAGDYKNTTGEKVNAYVMPG
jgi:hypothetical protein